MAKKFSELRAKMSPEAQARAAAHAEAMLVEMACRPAPTKQKAGSNEPALQDKPLA